MITRLSVRTRLLIVVAVPLLALGGLTAVFLNGQFEQRDDATNDLALTQAFAENGQAMAAMRAEQVLSASWMLSGDTAIGDQLSGVRAETDAAFAEATAALVQARIDDPTGTVERLTDRYGTMVSGLPDLRVQVDSTDAGGAADRLDDYDARADIAAEMNTTLVDATSPATDLSADLVLDQTMAANGRQFAYATVLTEPGDPNDVVEGRFDSAGERADSLYLSYRTTLANAAERSIVDAARRDDGAREAGANTQALASGVTAEELGTTPAEFGPAAVSAIQVFDEAKTEILDSNLQASSLRVDEANQQVQVAIAIAAVAFIITALIASLVVRSVIRPLRKLSEAAEELAADTLPRLVDSLVNPAIEAPAVTDLGMEGNDEICQLASAFNDVQQSIVDVSSRQSEVVTRGISDMYINLARRNQSLLDRQIQYIDSLESTEQDPDQLERLFRLDHLATRMRRNAESLLVLAGAEQGKRRTKAVPLQDVVRVAIGEVEDYQRLDILEIGDVALRGDAAVDLAHLLSELMENGTQYSPPETTVDVVGHVAPDGAYAVVLTDRGMGMSQDQLDEANSRLAVAPALGLGAGRSLGFVVVAALAARHQISVRLSAGTNGGVVAAVTLPRHLVDPDANMPAPPSMYATETQPAQVVQAQEPVPAPVISDAPTPPSWAPAGHESNETSGVPAEYGQPEYGQPEAPVQPTADPNGTMAPPPGPLPTRGGAQFGEQPAFEREAPASWNSDAGNSDPVGEPAEAPTYEPVDESREPIGWGTAFPGQINPQLDPYADHASNDGQAADPSAVDPSVVDPGAVDPRTLGEAVPLGDAFEMGLYSLLDDDSPADGQFTGGPQAAAPAPPAPKPASSGPSLPTRAQGETLGEETHDPDAVVAGASSRSPEQVRSLLSNYRSARDQGKRDAASEAPAPPSAGPAPTSDFDPLGGWDYAAAENAEYPDEAR